MIIAIQCASTKQPGAPGFVSSDGRKVVFVAHPRLAPPEPGIWWAHPDELSDVPAVTWRERVERENAAGSRRLRLLPAAELYRPAAYRRLVTTFGLDRVLILSAGWGLVRAGYSLPTYDITFSAQAEPYKRRRRRDRYSDFVQVDSSLAGPLVFLGGKDYLPLFAALTRYLNIETIVPFRCDPDDVGARPHRDGAWVRIPFRTPAKTNWHYECAQWLCDDPTLLARDHT